LEEARWEDAGSMKRRSWPSTHAAGPIRVAGPDIEMDQRHPSLASIFLYFFRLSWAAFGGPLAYISMMEDDCVERRKWLSKEEFAEMLGVTNMLPGPNATEMAIHIGHAKAGKLGGILAGLGFIIPSFIMILGLSWFYFRYGKMPGVDGFFYGVNPVVVAIILLTVLRLGRSTITDSKLACLFLITLLSYWFPPDWRGSSSTPPPRRKPQTRSFSRPWWLQRWSLPSGSSLSFCSCS